MYDNIIKSTPIQKKTKLRQLLYTLPFLVFLIVTLISTTAYSTASFPNKELEQKWYILNHYDQNGVSDIQNDNFFLHTNGQHNPLDEYMSFIDLLKKQKKNDIDNTNICRFPARVTLLKKHFIWAKQISLPICSTFLAEMKPDKIQSASLIFASGYFNNPGSYYGHVLLRFNYTKDTLNQETLNSSLNYGANSTDRDGSIAYILNGVFGGYSASYQRNNNFIHSNRYTNGELRDLWEYELNLSKEELQFLIEHSWELMNAEFKYYFFNDNCAHRVLDLIERATSKGLKDTHGFWLLPIQVIQNINKPIDKTPSLIKKETYHPSLKQLFEYRYNALTSTEKNRFKQFFSSKSQENNLLIKEMSNRTLFSILDYLDIEIAKITLEKKDQNKKKQLDKKRQSILNELFQRPPQKHREQESLPPKGSILEHRPTSTLRTGYAHRNSQNAFSVKYQIANNDLIDNIIPRQEKSRLIMGAIEFDLYKDNIDLRDITLIDITNLNTSLSLTPLTSEYSWQVKLGYEHINQSCDKCAAFGFTGKVGKSIRITDQSLTYGLIGGRINHKETLKNDYVSLLGNTGIIFDINEKNKLNTELFYSSNLQFNKKDLSIKIDYSHQLDTETDIRISTEHSSESNNTFIVRIGKFFN